MLKNGTILEVNNNSVLSKYGDKSFTRNYQDCYSSVNSNSNAKLKKFNSYSTKIKYKSNSNSNNGLTGFYVTPIFNAPKRIITVQVPQNEIIELGKDNYHVENIMFQTSPKKYNYKPYKQPKRKSKLRPQYNTNYQSYQIYQSQSQNQKKKCTCYCNCPGCNRKKY